MTSPPFLELVTPSFSIAFLLGTFTHVVQFGGLPFGAKDRNGNHLHLRLRGAGGIFVDVLEIWTSNWLIAVSHINRQLNAM